MKHLFLLIFLLAINIINAQKEYFISSERTMTKVQLNQTIEALKRYNTNRFGNSKNVNYLTNRTVFKKDSILNYIEFVTGEKPIIRSKYYNKKLIFKLKGLDGNEINLQSYKGKPTLLTMWFTKCKVCIKDEMPVLNEIKKEYGDRVNFVAVTFDSKEKVEKFVKDYPFDFIHTIEAKHFIKELEIARYPQNLIIDQNGVLIRELKSVPWGYQKDGEFKKGRGNEIRKIIDMLLQNKSTSYQHRPSQI